MTRRQAASSNRPSSPQASLTAHRLVRFAAGANPSRSTCRFEAESLLLVRDPGRDAGLGPEFNLKLNESCFRTDSETELRDPGLAPACCADRVQAPDACSTFASHRPAAGVAPPMVDPSAPPPRCGGRNIWSSCSRCNSYNGFNRHKDTPGRERRRRHASCMRQGAATAARQHRNSHKRELAAAPSLRCGSGARDRPGLPVLGHCRPGSRRLQA